MARRYPWLTDASINRYGDAVRAGAVQLNSTEDLDHNLETADRLVRQAAAQGAGLGVFPEERRAPGTSEQVEGRAPARGGGGIRWAGLAFKEPANKRSTE